MTPNQFLNSIWPSDGLYCIAHPATKGYKHKVFESVDAAVAYIEQIKDNTDVFFCIHSLKEPRVWNPSKGDEGGWSVRLQTNMQEARAFFFDLDVGDGEKKYASQAEALKALRRFCVDTALPTPTITSSGGGLHVYWLLDVSIPSNEWRTYAARLKRLADHYGLKADPARTTDTASVLRVAGTYNHKRGEKRPVRALKVGVTTALDDFLKILNDACIRADITNTEPVAAAPAIDPYFGENNIDRPRSEIPADFKDVLKECRQVRYLAVQRGAVDEPAWQASLNIVRFCEKSDELIHKISDKHPEYDFDKTVAKVHRLEIYRHPVTGKPLGPTTCGRLATVLGTERCSGCAHLSTPQSSPIVYARRSASAPPPVVQVKVADKTIDVQIPAPPKPYLRTKDGRIEIQSTNKDGEKVNYVLYEYDLFPVRRMRNELANKEIIVWQVAHPRDGMRSIELNAGALYDRKQFVADIANAGIYVQNDRIKELQDYMIAYIAELQRHAAADAQTAHLGWTAEKDGFILPDKIVYTNGTTKPVLLADPALTYGQPLHKRGTLQRQIELLEFYNHPAYVRSQFAILCSLAAPFFGMTGQNGVIVNCTGETGASKSSTLYAAASLWGNPEKFTINATKDGATVHSRNAKLYALSNLPICLDEITTIGLEEARNMAMGISQSQGRTRVNRDGSPKKEPDNNKATIVIATSNNSLHGLLSTNNSASTAASMRVFEIFFPKQYVHKMWEADDFLHELKQNYGHIGELIMQEAVPHSKMYEDAIREELKKINIECDAIGGERFWPATGAPVLVIGRLANRMGLLKYDIDHIRKWLIEEQIPAMRGIVHEEYSTPIGVLTDYMEIISGNTLVVQRFKSNPGMINTIKKPVGQLLAHYDYEDKTLWVLRKGFKDYCAKIGANFLKVIDDLYAPQTDASGKRMRVITNKNIKKVLGAGTEFGKAQSWCFVVDLKHPDCLGLPDLSVVNNPSADLTPPTGDLKLIEEF